MKLKIKAGDEVVILAGNERGERGKVLQVLPRKERVLVEGINKRKHHEKKSEENPEGAIVERECPIHLSNVMLAGRYDEKRGVVKKATKKAAKKAAKKATKKATKKTSKKATTKSAAKKEASE